MTWYSRQNAWLFIFGRYLPYLALFSLGWEILQLPLYTLVVDARPALIAYAVAHCTAGDILIGTLALMAALAICGADARADWPRRKIILVALLIGIAYTILSERYHLASGSWAYSSLMPMVPGLKIGWSPLLQWLVVPVTAWRLANPGRSVV